MSELALSPNVAHANNTQVLAGAIEMGAEAIMGCLGTEEVSSQFQGVEYTLKDVQEALAARLSAKLTQ